jgi:hypothetical protein
MVTKPPRGRKKVQLRQLRKDPTTTGVVEGEVEVVALPNCPAALSPQQRAVPSARLAHVWPNPPATALVTTALVGSTHKAGQRLRRVSAIDSDLAQEITTPTPCRAIGTKRAAMQIPTRDGHSVVQAHESRRALTNPSVGGARRHLQR